MPKAECRCDATCGHIFESQLMQIPSLFSPLSIIVYDIKSHHACSMICIRKRVFRVPSVHMHTATMSVILHYNVLRVSITAFNCLTTTQVSFEKTVAVVTCECTRR